MNGSDRVTAASRPIPFRWIAACDLLVAALAPVAALVLRRGDLTDLDAYVVYWLASVACSVACYGVFKLGRGIWRYFSWRDIPPIASSVLTSVGAASLISFSIDRMNTVSRSEPLLHAAFLFGGLVLVRLVARQIERSKTRARKGPASGGAPVRQALVIGSSPLSELYLRMVDEMRSLTRAPVDVVGLLAEKPRHVDRTIRGRRVLGTIDELDAVLKRMTVHGVEFGLIVIGANPRFISPEVRDRLAALERDGAQIVHLEAILGSTSAAQAPALAAEALAPTLGIWPGKRLFDLVLASALILALSPLLVLLCLAVFLDVGAPIIFWQVRPGLHGVPTRFFKFRTMRGVSQDGTVLSDEARVSRLGRLLRRMRFDELPQLFNILLGQMSFIGPRPLLQRDLHEDGAARCRMRPGVTGWAQVKGGKLIEARDKMALDLWYGQHASLWLDLRILWLTARVVLLGDVLDHEAIRAARLFVGRGSGPAPSFTSPGGAWPAEPVQARSLGFPEAVVLRVPEAR